MYKVQESAKEIKLSDEEISERTGAPLVVWTPRCNPAKEDMCGPCTEGISLHRQICETEKLLATLKTMQESNNTKINIRHDPLSRLPTELASDIFMYLRPLPMELSYSLDVHNLDDVAKSMKNPLLLGAVCRAWRTFAWSIPQLWSTISVNVYNESEEVPTMIRQWLGRSGQLPLSIYLYTARRRLDDGLLSPHPYGDEPFVERIMAVINEHSARWFYLNLDIPKRFMQRVHCSGSEAPMLESLALQLVIDEDDEIEDAQLGSRERIKIGPTPNLKRIHVLPLTFDDIDTDWASVTQAEFSFLTPDMCCDLLRQAPALTHLILHDIDLDVFDRPSSIVRHQTLISLQMLGGRWDEGPDELLTYLDLPALEDLGIFAGARSELTTVAGFLQRSSCTLKAFRVNICDHWLEHKRELIMLFDKMPCLEYLSLECQYHQSDASPLGSQFPSFATIQELQSINEQLFLPNLKRVCIKLGLYPESYSVDLRPDGPNIASPPRSECSHIVPSINLLLKPIHIYPLLDMETQRTLHPIIQSNIKIKSSSPDLNSFVDLLRKFLYHHAYDAGTRLSS